MKVKMRNMHGAALLPFKTRRYSLPAICLSIALAPPVLACPSVLFNSELGTPIVGVRAGLRLFSWRAEAGLPPKFHEVPIEVDPLDQDGHLQFFSNENWRFQDMQSTDLMVFRGEGFGARWQVGQTLPCRGATVYELSNHLGQYAYLTNCAPQVAPSRYPSPIRFDRQGHKLQSSSYIYRFNPENYMQFHEVAFGSDKTGWIQAAKDSRLDIFVDVKRFFSMHFDSRQIESRMESYRLGPVANLARLTFFLRVLFFKIKMSLSTDVGFFEDAAHIPMMVNVPVESDEYLHSGSGILYSWIPGAAMRGRTPKVQMPELDPTRVHEGWQKLAVIAKPYCRNGNCEFRYTLGTGDGRQLEMQLNFASSVIERGFFPFYVSDVQRFAKAMDWDMPADASGQPRVGMYFEVSGLPKGGHPWDFWLRLGGQSARSSVCPASLTFAEVSKRIR